VAAYVQRVDEEDAVLQSHFATSAIHHIDGTQSPHACLQRAKEALRAAANAAGDEIYKALMKAEASVGVPDVDWASQLRATVSRLDAEVHPDGRARSNNQRLPHSSLAPDVKPDTSQGEEDL
jgi:hypothetical protein